MNQPPERVGSFQILERIGGDATCDVYKGYDAALDRNVAVKILKSELVANLELVHRFHRTATATAQVAHPNVVAVHFVGQEEDCHFVVMQYVRGQTLASRLTLENHLPCREAVDIGRQCLRGLEAAHGQGLVHGHLSADKVLLEQDTGRAVLVDFGQMRTTHGVSRPAAVAENGRYLAPEQAAGQRATPRTDLYSVGVLFQEMLSGRQSSQDGSDAESSAPTMQKRPEARNALAPEAPAPLRRVVERLAAPDPAQRYADCGEALRELAVLTFDGPSADSPTEAAPGSENEPRAASSIFSTIPLRRRITRRQIELIAMVSVLLVLLVCQRVYMAIYKRQLTAATANRLGMDAAELEEMPAYNPPAHPPKSLLTDCVLYLTFDRDTIENQEDLFIVKDLSGNDNHGVVFGAMLEEKGKVGGALRFNASPDYVSLPTLPGDVVRSGKPVSLSLWVNDSRYKPTAYVFNATVGRDCPGISLERGALDRGFSFTTPWKPEQVKVEDVGSRVWHHIVGVWDGRSSKIYVDGHLAREKAVDLKSPQRRTKVPDVSGARIGAYGFFRRGGDIGFEGLLDEVMIFRRALFAEEVRALYEMGQEAKRPEPPAPSPSLVGFLSAFKLWSAERQEAFDAHLRAVAEKRKKSPPESHPDNLNIGCTRTSDGKVVLVGHPWGWVIQYSYGDRTEKTVGRGQPPPHPLSGLVMSPNDRCAACYGPTGQIFMWDIAARRASHQINTSLKEVLAVAFSADGRLLAAGGKSGNQGTTIGIWDSDSGRQLRSFGASGMCTAVACSREGDHILAATMPDRQFHLSRISEKRDVRRFSSFAAEVTCVQFLPGGTMAISGCSDGLIWLLDLEKGREICALKAHLSKVTCLAVSPDGRYAISGSEDSSARIWDLNRRVRVEEFGAADDPVCYVGLHENPLRMCVATTHGSFYDFPLPISNMPAPPKAVERSP